MKCIYKLIACILINVTLISCDRNYIPIYKTENLKDIMISVEENYKISSTESSINISFQIPSNSLGDVRFGYNAYQVTENGKVEIPKALPNKILSFCERNEIASIEISYVNDQAGNPHYLIVLRKQQKGLSRNKSIVYFKDEKFYFPGQLKEELLSDKIYLITTKMDIM
jgi:hypothetical protein